MVEDSLMTLSEWTDPYNGSFEGSETGPGRYRRLRNS